HADDVGADRVLTVACLAFGDRPKHLEGLCARRVQHPSGLLAALEGLEQTHASGLGALLEPGGLTEQLADDTSMDQGVLAHVEPGEVEAEGLSTPEQASHEEEARVLAVVDGQAVGDALE